MITNSSVLYYLLTACHAVINGDQYYFRRIKVAVSQRIYLFSY